MSDTTTVEIEREQKAQLDELKVSEYEPYKAVIGRLIDSFAEDD